jgi:ABC-type uncharacterized transport system permease subunit
LVENFSNGIGFTGIVVALLGALSPIGSVVAGVFFGVLISGANQMQRVLGISANLVLVIQGAAVLFVLSGRHAAEYLFKVGAKRRTRIAWDDKPEETPIAAATGSSNVNGGPL